ncbi:10887_t:CDS:1, partial [Gigaspora rosea]
MPITAIPYSLSIVFYIVIQIENRINRLVVKLTTNQFEFYRPT